MDEIIDSNDNKQPSLFRKPRSGQRYFTPDEEKQMAVEYAAGAFLSDLVRKWGSTKATVSTAIKRAGAIVLSRIEANRRYHSTFSLETQLRIRADYEACHNIAAVARKYNAPHPTIRQIIRRAGGKTQRNRHTLNENAFNDAECNREACYWLGFLLADGCVTEKAVGQTMLSVGLHRKDVDHLRRLRDFLGSSHSISDNGRHVRYSVKSDHLAQTLSTYGIVPRKSLIAKVPEVMKFNRDFWRGVVDGDGCLSFYKHRRGWIRPTISLIGTLNVIESFRDFARSVSPGSKSEPTKADKIWHIYICSRHAVALAAYLYQDGDVALSRKAESARKMASLL